MISDIIFESSGKNIVSISNDDNKCHNLNLNRLIRFDKYSLGAMNIAGNFNC